MLPFDCVLNPHTTAERETLGVVGSEVLWHEVVCYRSETINSIVSFRRLHTNSLFGHNP